LLILFEVIRKYANDQSMSMIIKTVFCCSDCKNV